MTICAGDRIPDRRWGTPIGEALHLLTPQMIERIGNVRWVCGVSPFFAGFAAYSDAQMIPTGESGSSYADIPHCCYPWHIARPLAERRTTIVLPHPPTRSTVMHELGHALHERLEFRPVAVPLTDYARTNTYEAFAEAFMIAHTRPLNRVEAELAASDQAIVHLFADLAT
jgi:hypothetical protein